MEEENKKIPENFEMFLASELEFNPEDVYKGFLKEEDIFMRRKDKESLFWTWINAANPTWISFSLTSPRFSDKILEEVLRDENQNN